MREPKNQMLGTMEPLLMQLSVKMVWGIVLVLSILYNLFSINEAKSQAHTESIGNTSTALFCLLNLMFKIDFIENEDFVMFLCVQFIDR